MARLLIDLDKIYMYNIESRSRSRLYSNVLYGSMCLCTWYQYSSDGLVEYYIDSTVDQIRDQIREQREATHSPAIEQRRIDLRIGGSVPVVIVIGYRKRCNLALRVVLTRQDHND